MHQRPLQIHHQVGAIRATTAGFKETPTGTPLKNTRKSSQDAETEASWTVRVPSRKWVRYDKISLKDSILQNHLTVGEGLTFLRMEFLM